MNKKDNNDEFVGCGGNCACAQNTDEKNEECAPPEGGVVFDKDGKCPCGKSEKDCCHKKDSTDNEAIHELCEPHNGKHVCDVPSDLEKTAP